MSRMLPGKMNRLDKYSRAAEMPREGAKEVR